MDKEEVKKLCLEIYDKNLDTKFKLLRYDLNGTKLLDHLKNTYGQNLKLTEYLYQGIHDKDISCSNGNNLKFKNIYDGYGFCGIACKCKKEHQKNVLKDQYNNLSEEEKILRIEKAKQTNLERYGVENPAMMDEIKNKIKQTNLEKYGVEYYSKTNEYKEKIKQTSLDKYGVEHFTQNQDIKNKIEDTTMKKYGGMMVAARMSSEEKFCGNVFSSDWFIDNSKQFYMDSFGAEHPLKSEKIKENMIKNNIEKYGVENPAMMDEIKEKMKQTNQKRYGVDYFSQSDEYSKNYDIYAKKTKLTSIEKYGTEHPTQKHYNLDYVNIFNNVDSFKQLLYKHGTYKLAELINCDVTTIHKFANQTNIILPPRPKSHQEEIITDFLTKNDIPFVSNTKKILPSGKELDFYFPDNNLAIEINGIYWHSEISGGKDKLYHYNKWKECDDLGITLLSIYEDNFSENTQFWFNKILYMTGKMKPTKIHARKCEIHELDNVNDFLNEHHLQGSCASTYKVGLFYNGELVSVMTFSNTRNNSKDSIDLSRFCNHSGYTVSGGASKLLSYFVKTYGHLYESITSFSDNNYSNGNVYKALGFELIENMKPDYKYIIKGKCYHKANFRKSSIFKKFDIPDDMKNATEWELMKYLGYDRIWDTGKKKWKMKI